MEIKGKFLIFENSKEFYNFYNKILMELELEKGKFINTGKVMKVGKGAERPIIQVEPSDEMDISQLVTELKLFEEKLRKLDRYNEQLKSLKEQFESEVEKLKEKIKTEDGITLTQLENMVKKAKKEIGKTVEEISNITINKAFTDLKNDIEKIQKKVNGFVLIINNDISKIKLTIGSAKHSISYSNALKKLPDYFRDKLKREELSVDIDKIVSVLNESISEVKELTRVIKQESRIIETEFSSEYFKSSSIKTSTKEFIEKYYSDEMLTELDLKNIVSNIKKKIINFVNSFIKFKNKLLIKLGLLDINRGQIEEIVSKWI